VGISDRDIASRTMFALSDKPALLCVFADYFGLSVLQPTLPFFIEGVCLFVCVGVCVFVFACPIVFACMCAYICVPCLCASVGLRACVSVCGVCLCVFV